MTNKEIHAKTFNLRIDSLEDDAKKYPNSIIQKTINRVMQIARLEGENAAYEASKNISRLTNAANTKIKENKQQIQKLLSE